MQKENIINLLKQYQSDLIELDLLTEEYQNKKDEYEKITYSHSNKLKKFDEENLSAYIYKKVGSVPIYKEKLFFKSKAKKEYEEQLEEYKLKVEEANKEYLEFYKEERESLKEADRLENINLFTDLDEIKNEYEILNNKVKGIDFLHKKYQSLKIVEKLIELLELGRADDLKEALNIYENEERIEKEFKKIKADVSKALALCETTKEELTENLEVVADAVYKLYIAINNISNDSSNTKRKSDFAYWKSLSDIINK